MLFYPYSETALDQFYDNVSTLINYSDGRYSLQDVLNMIPWELTVYLVKYAKYIEQKNKNS